MTAKKWLMRGIEADEKIKALEETRDKIQSRLMSCSGGMAERVQGGERHDLNARLAEINEMISDEIEKSCAIKTEILGAINLLDDDRMHAVMVRRYINGMAWRKIANSMHYDERTVYRLHGDAIYFLIKTKCCQ